MRRGGGALPVLPLAGLLALGIVSGAVAAGLFRQMTVARDHGPCFGYGTPVASRAYTASSAGVENAKDIGLALQAGERREARACQANPMERVTIDGATGAVLGHEYTLDIAAAYYRAHPEEVPSRRMQQLEAAAARAAFVAPPADVAGLLRQPGCASGWSSYESASKGVRACLPAGWRVDDSVAHRLLLESANVTLNVHSVESPNALECAQPARVAGAAGDIEVCAVTPQEGGQSYHLLLPNGVKLYLFVSDRTPAQERAEAFRVAGSVGRLR